MCGIVGYIGTRQAQDVLISGLAKLEYRGYDSAGVAVGEGRSKAAGAFTAASPVSDVPHIALLTSMSIRKGLPAHPPGLTRATP